MGSQSTPYLVAGIPSGQEIREVVTSPLHQVGTKGQTMDGRTFFYASSTGAAIVAGQLLMSEVVVANNANINPSAAAAVGAKSVAITLGGSSTIAKDAFAGGYLVVNDADGEGLTYVISGNTAVAAGTAITVTLDDEIAVALTTSSEVTLVKSQYSELVIAAAGHVHRASGVAQTAVPAGTSDTQYFWVQSSGVTAGWDDAATAIGAVLQSGTTPGQFEVGDGAAQVIGTQLYTGVATEYYPKDLKIND